MNFINSLIRFIRNIKSENLQICIAKYVKDIIVLEYLAKSKYLSEEAQLILAKNEITSIRLYLTENKNMSDETKLILATDKNYWVRYYLAYNFKKLPNDVFNILKKDSKSAIRNIAINRAANYYNGWYGDEE